MPQLTHNAVKDGRELSALFTQERQFMHTKARPSKCTFCEAEDFNLSYLALLTCACNARSELTLSFSTRLVLRV